MKKEIDLCVCRILGTAATSGSATLDPGTFFWNINMDSGEAVIYFLPVILHSQQLDNLYNDRC